MKKEVTNTSNEEEKQFNVVKAIDLIHQTMNEPEPKYIWKGIPEGSTGLITGVAKTGKTTFAENMAISLSIGKKEFYGYQMDGIPRKVVFINLEESRKLRSRRNHKQIVELNPAELELFSENYISTPESFPNYLNDEEDWKVMRKYITATNAEIVFIDSLGHMCIGEIEKSSVAQKFTQTFNNYIGSLNKTVIIVHHMTKGNDKPIDQDCIAGSRFILQEFEFAYGFANIPTSKGGNYSCMLYNKHIEKDDTTATIYRMNSSRWIDLIGTDNKFNLYQSVKRDGRNDTVNKNKLILFIESMVSQGSQTITSDDLIKKFVQNSTMSKDTLYQKIKILENEGILERKTRGIYEIKLNVRNESGL